MTYLSSLIPHLRELQGRASKNWRTGDHGRHDQLWADEKTCIAQFFNNGLRKSVPGNGRSTVKAAGAHDAANRLLIVAVINNLDTLLTAAEQDHTATEGWQDIATAPKDGTVIDVWRDEGGRDTVYWGRPPHDCGEMGPYCDSDWHSDAEPSWVCATFGESVGGKHNPFTHWRPLPPPPTTLTTIENKGEKA